MEREWEIVDWGIDRLAKYESSVPVLVDASEYE